MTLIKLDHGLGITNCFDCLQIGSDPKYICLYISVQVFSAVDLDEFFYRICDKTLITH